METQRHNPPARKIAADSRSDMASSERKKASSDDFEGDPIVQELRRLYDGVVDEPLPDDLLELLRRLDEVERNR